MDNGAENYRRYLEGDDSAFENIMKEYRSMLTRFIAGYVGDEASAEDIAIDVFADLIVHKNRFDFRVSLKTYLFMLGRSRSIDHLRHMKRTRTVSLDEISELIGDGEPENGIIEKERKTMVKNALDSLPANMREAVILVYFQNMSYAECAKIMKKSVKQIDNLLFKAKKRLRLIMGEEGESYL